MRSLLVIILISLWTVPVVAQRQTESETGSHILIPRRARIPDPALSAFDRGRIAIDEYARCLIDSKLSRVVQVLALEPGEEYDRAVGKLVIDTCLESGSMKFKSLAIRGPLFAELFRRRLADEARGKSWSASVSPIDLKALSPAASGMQGLHYWMMDFGKCAVDQNPSVAKQIVLEHPATKGQDEAISALAPKLSACLSQGSSIKLDKASLQAMLAEVLYRGVVAQVPANPATIIQKSGLSH